MSWLFFAIASVVAASFSKILQRVLMRSNESDPISYSIVFQLISALLIWIYAFLNGFVVPPIKELYLYFILGGILYGFGTLFLFKALKTLQSSEEVIITSSRSLITIITAIILLGENFNLQKAAGTLLILTAIVIVTLKKEKFVFNQGVIYAFGMAFCYGLAVTNDAFILKRYNDAVSYAAISFTLPPLILLLSKPKTIIKMTNLFNPQFLKRMLPLSLVYSTAAVAFFTALERGANASQLAPINQAQVVVTVILAAILLSERDNLARKIISAIMIFAGVLLLK